jgi:hypothetical protein
MNTVVLATAALCLGQYKVERGYYVERVPMAPTKAVRTYADAYKDAHRAGQHLVVGIGCQAPNGSWESITVDSLEGYQAPCIVVSKPHDDIMAWVATLPPDADHDQVNQYVSRKEVRQSPAPFRQQVQPRLFQPQRFRVIRSSNC